jgi:hypothetical protein
MPRLLELVVSSGHMRSVEAISVSDAESVPTDISDARQNKVILQCGLMLTRLMVLQQLSIGGLDVKSSGMKRWVVDVPPNCEVSSLIESGRPSLLRARMALATAHDSTTLLHDVQLCIAYHQP